MGSTLREREKDVIANQVHLYEPASCCYSNFIKHRCRRMSPSHTERKEKRKNMKIFTLNSREMLAREAVHGLRQKPQTATAR